MPVNASNRAGWVWGEQRHVPRIAARIGADVVHSLASTAPLRGPLRRVTTIHDLNYRNVPEAHFGLRGLGMRMLVPAAVRRSHRVIVDAASTKRDLVAQLGAPASASTSFPSRRTCAPGWSPRRRANCASASDSASAGSC